MKPKTFEEAVEVVNKAGWVVLNCFQWQVGGPMKWRANLQALGANGSTLPSFASFGDGETACAAIMGAFAAVGGKKAPPPNAHIDRYADALLASDEIDPKLIAGLAELTAPVRGLREALGGSGG